MLKCRKAQIRRDWKHKKAHFVACESKNGNSIRLVISVALGSTRLRVLQELGSGHCSSDGIGVALGSTRLRVLQVEIFGCLSLIAFVALGSTRLRVLQVFKWV